MKTSYLFIRNFKSRSDVLTILVVFLFASSGTFAQSPQKMSYQSVVRDNAGALVTSQTVGVQISLLQGSATGSVVYRETYSPKPQTNANGLLSLDIGSGTPVTGTFSSINWAAGPYFLKTETDPSGGSSYTIVSTSQLLSVPYALHAKTVETGDNWGSQVVSADGTLSGNGLIASPLKIAQAGATSGQVLGWTGTTWAPQTLAAGSNPWLSSGSDIYFNAGKVGIGKMPGADSRQFQVLTGTYQAIAGVNNSTLGTIYAQNNGTGPAADFRNKLLIVDGTQGTGKVLTSDAAGYTSWQTPAVITDASLTGNGTAATPLKLASFGASYGQVLKWTGTEWNNTTDDTGPWSETASYIYNAEGKKFGMGISVPTQKLTLADGSTPCYMNIQNSSSGYTSVDGMLLGMSGLNSYVSSYEAGSLYLGTNATVRLAIVSDGKVGIGTLTPGYKLDVNGAVNLNKGIASAQALCVNGDEALWYDGTYFSWGYGGTWNYFKDAVAIDCQPGLGHMLAVNGVASKPGGGSWTAFSDGRLKDVKGNYERGLKDIIQLQPVRFNYKNGNPLKLPSVVEYFGFIAQDVQRIFPETVTENKNGYLEFDMQGVNVAFVNAFKELNAKMESLQQENDRLKAEKEQVNARLERLEQFMGELGIIR